MTAIPFTRGVSRLRRRWKVIHARKPAHIAIRAVQWTLATIAALWLIYIIAANVALRSRWARDKANNTPQVLQVDYASAWTIFPGIVHLTKVAGYGQFTGFEYEGQVDQLRINVGLLGLLHHRVILDIHASGVALQGKSPKSVKPVDPVIAAPVPLYQVAAPPVPVVDESLATWTIDVDLQLTDGRELWVDGVRYDGPLTAKGKMRTTPNRSFEIQKLSVEADGGKVLVGKKTALPRLMARIDVELDPVDPRAVDLGAFDRLTVDATLGGKVGEMSFVQDLAARPLPVVFAGDGGAFGIRGRLDHGKLAAPGMAKVSNEGMWAGFAGTGVAGAVDAEGFLEPSPDGPVARLNARVTRGEVTTKKGEAFVLIPVTRSTATATHLDLTNPKSMRFVFQAHAPRATVPRLTVLNRFFEKSDVKILGGTISGAADVHGDFPKGAIDGDLTFSTGPIGMTFDGTTLQGRLDGKIPVRRVSSQDDYVISGARVHAHDAFLDNDTSHTRDWWGIAVIPHGLVHCKGDTQYIGAVNATFRDIDPVITAVRKLHGVPEWVNDLLGIGPYDVDAFGRFGKHTKIDLVDARAKAMGFIGHPHTRVRAVYDGTRDVSAWRTDIDFGVLALGIEKSGSHVGVQLIDVASWFDHKSGLR